MGKWVEIKPKPWSPCDDCQAAYCVYSYKVENGKEYTKTDDCHETCKRYKDWLKGKLTGKKKKDEVIVECGDVKLHMHKRGVIV